MATIAASRARPETEAPTGARLARGDLAAVAGYALLTAGFFWQLLFVPGTWIPKGGGDLASFLYPVHSFTAAQLQRGVLPLWNPYLYSGAPHLADIQTGIFYPLHLIAFLAIRPFSYGVLEGLAVLHYFLAALFTYACARAFGLGRLGAFGAGLVFAFSGFMVAHLGHLNMIEAATWLPLTLLCLHQALQTGRWRWAAAGGAAYGVSILAGHFQMSLYLAFFLGLYWLWSAVAQRRPGLSLSRRVGVIVCFGLVAVGLAAVQLLPSYELARLSIRADLPYRRAIEFAATPLGFITFLAPHFFGGDNLAYWGVKGSLAEVYGYVGVVTLALAGLAILLPRVQRRAGGGATTPEERRADSWRWFLVGATVLCLLLSIGELSPLHGWLYRFIPGFDKVRAPGRFVLLIGLSLALLGGAGLDALTRPFTFRQRPALRLAVRAGGLVALLALAVAAYFYRALLLSQDKDPTIFNRVAAAIASLNLSIALFLVALGLLWAFLRWRATRPVVPALLVAVLAIDLLGAGATFNPTSDDVTVQYQHPQVLAFLRSQPGPFRVDSVTNVWDVWAPDTTLLAGIEDVMGIFNPMLLADYDRYWGGLGSRSAPAYDLLNARFVIAKKDVQLDWSKFQPVLTDAPQVNVYENQRALPRAVLVPQTEVVPRDGQMARLTAADFDPRRLALVESPIGLENASSSAESPGEVLAVEHPTVNESVVRVRSSRTALLLLSELEYPGWRAQVDGAAVPIVRVDYLFRGVVVPAGEHSVHFSFEPRLFQLGLALSGLTCLGLLVGAVALLAQGRRRGLR